MTIRQFDVQNGRYAFRESNLVTEFHAHPALELIVATEGSFSLSAPGIQLTDIRAALISPNRLHAFHGEHCTCDFFFFEPGQAVLDRILAHTGQSLSLDGIIALEDRHRQTLQPERLLEWNEAPLVANFDERVKDSIQYILQWIDAPRITLSELARQVHLSPGRLSHLFKQQMGLPVQRYIVWTRMKVAVDLVVRKNMPLTEAAHTAGFYDAAHFSKHFRDIFGVKPSAVYNNSRIVQL